MKTEISEDMISLKTLAKVSDPVEWQKEYASIRQRTARNYYKTYQKIGGKGYINKNDESIPESLRNTILNGLQSLVKQSLMPEKLTTKTCDIELTLEETERCLAYSSVIKLYLEYLSNNGKDENTRVKFVNLYNHNAFPELYKHTSNLGSWKTIERWKKEYLDSGNDFRVFADKKIDRGSSIPPHQAEVLIKLALNPNQPLTSEVVRMSIDIFAIKRDETILHKNTYRRFIEKWSKEHYADWVFFREGEHALDNKILPYLERDYDRIEVGDIIIMDGHVNNYEIINPYTGKPKRMQTIGALDMKSNYLAGYEISPTENTHSIAVALRRAILNLGKVPKVLYIDNGRAFGAKYFHGDDMENIVALLARLGIKVIFAQAYHAQGKNIERTWGIMAELERMMPTYSGTSITLQPPRMNRGEKLHVKLYEKMMTGTTIDIFTAHRALAWWLDEYHSRVQQQGHLKGLTPAEVFNAGKGPGVDKKELNFLMMQAEIKTLYRNGIRMFSTSYWHEALFGKQWDEVLIRYDILEHDSIFVYDKNGEFICEAKRFDKVHPAAGILGNEEDVRILHEQLERKGSLKKSIVGDAKKFLQEEIYPYAKKQFDNMNIIQLNEAEETKQPENTEKPKSRKRKNISDSWELPEDNPCNNRDTISKIA
jgi:putative transposase